MKREDFNGGWRFYKHGGSHAEFIDLPHDAMIHERRDPASEGGGAIGFFTGGVYIYEKDFFVPRQWEDKCVIFEFEGVYRNSKVYINDQEAGGRPYGYSNFYVNADPFLIYGQENTVRVVVDNSKLPNSRWYSGSGIYRPVKLIVGNKTHIDLDGIKISTLSYRPARILVEVSHNGGRDAEVEVEILFEGRIVAGSAGERVELDIPDAKLWSDTEPYLYQCRAVLKEKGVMVDEVVENFGIRLIEWSNRGLFINGKEVKLRGGCIHHDNGILGACAYDKAEERKVRIMKQAGYNAIRSAHNPMSKAMLDACDRYGMYVMDEAFDMWYIPKTKYDYSRDFEEWYLEDIKAMVEKDRNHPCVIMYSIGNEVTEPAQERGVELARKMVDYIHKLDPTRPVTAGINLMLMYMASKGKGVYKESGEDVQAKHTNKQQVSGSTFYNMMVSMIGRSMNNMARLKAVDRVATPVLDLLDIAGYNYGSGRYKLEGKKHPNRIIVGSETFPQDIAKNWKMVKELPYLIGDFMWAAWDYLGEAGIGAWTYGEGGFFKRYPWLLAQSGAIDILGNIEAEAKYAKVVWELEDKPCICVRPPNHLGEKVYKSAWRGTNAVESWSWENCEGNPVEIEVYSGAHFVELLVNGKSLGIKRVKDYKAMYRTRYEEGVVTAVAYDENKREISRSELVSATGRTLIRVAPEESVVKPGEIVFVNIDLVGENDVIKSNSDRQLRVSVEGGTLLAFGSANPCTEERYDTGIHTTYYGRALAVVRSKSQGEMVISVSGDGLNTAVAKVTVT